MYNTKANYLLTFCLIMFSCSDPELEESERQIKINQNAIEQIKIERSINDQKRQLRELLLLDSINRSNSNKK